ncbi:hypothetical protein [uncultured Amnibacterium sp.]|uniref:hypothetical protein n=1 Tax=uncultured Amnibacterium sp. TaxID=1631851 RepID=UPI0035CACAC7
MDELKFDELVRDAGAVPRVRSTAVMRLAEESRLGRLSSRRRRPLVVVAAVSGVVLLAAATGTAALMKLPPFQGLEPEMYRTQASIAIEYRSITGYQNHCEAFLEFTNLSVKQADAADALVEQHDWSGIGQRSYDTAAAGLSDDDAIETRFTDVLGDQLHTVAVRALPGVASSGVNADGAASWSGWSMSCEGGQH